MTLTNVKLFSYSLAYSNCLINGLIIIIVIILNFSLRNNYLCFSAPPHPTPHTFAGSSQWRSAMI